MIDEQVEKLWEYQVMLLKEILKADSVDSFNTEVFPKRDLAMDRQLNEIGHLDMDEDLQIIAVYPLSPKPTEFEVDLGQHGTGYAMCAIDALGVVYTFGVPVRLTGIDHSKGHNMELMMKPDIKAQLGWQMYVSYKPYDKEEVAAVSQCPEICFYSDPEDIDQDSLEVLDFEDAVEHAHKRFAAKYLKQMTRSYLEKQQ